MRYAYKGTVIERRKGMDVMLSKLFDYQRFACNPRLAALIADTESRYPLERFRLEDAQLELNAAGDPDMAIQREKPDE